MYHAVLVAPRELQVNHRKTVLRRLPGAFDGYAVAHLSDLHLGSLASAAEHLRTVRQLRPDLFVVTGDLLERRASIDLCADLLGALDAPDGVVVVLGNHEHRAERRDPGHIDQLVRALTSRGVRTLINDAVALERGDSRLWLVGVDDPHIGKDNAEMALAKVPADEAAILLAHSPEVFLRFPAVRVEVAFTGHCHGGQVRTPWGAIMTRSRIRTPDVLGMQTICGIPVNMSGGMGSTIPLRILCPPEVTLLELRGD